MRAAGPATSPMTMAPRELSTRARMGVRATANRLDNSPARAAPRAKTPQPAEATGPIRAPARSSLPSTSASRIGWKVSNTTMATDQKTSTTTKPMSTRLWRRRPRPSRTRGVDVGARLLEQHEDRDQVHHVEHHEDHHGQDQCRLVPEGVPPDES